MVCLRNICINTLRKGDDDDDNNDDDNNNNNNNNYYYYYYKLQLSCHSVALVLTLFRSPYTNTEVRTLNRNPYTIQKSLNYTEVLTLIQKSVH